MAVAVAVLAIGGGRSFLERERERAKIWGKIPKKVRGKLKILRGKGKKFRARVNRGKFWEKMN